MDLQALVCRSMIEGRRMFVRLRTRKLEDGFLCHYKLQVLESEHLDNKSNKTLANGNVIRNGIEFNRLGQERHITYLENIQEKAYLENQ